MSPASEPALGPRLRALRESRGLARGEAAARGGASLQALKDWEAGRRTPRGPALDRLLRGLEAPAHLRAELVALADPRHARIALAAFPPGPPVDRGAMLRALRLRAGLTQGEVAARVGVAQSAVAQWEGGDRVPEDESLQRALFAVSARPEEAAALMASPHAPSPYGDDSVAAYGAIERLPGPLRELAMLAHERAMWWRAASEPGTEEALRRAMLHRALHYAFAGRMGESIALKRRLDAMTPDLATRRTVVGASIYLGDVRFRPGADPVVLFRRLHRHEAELPASDVRAWLKGTCAVALAAAGEASSLTLAQEALAEAERMDDRPIEAWHRRVDLAEVHLRLGDPEAALEALGDDHLHWDHRMRSPTRAPAGLAVRARALLALGQEPEPELMTALRDHAAFDGRPFYAARFAGVERAIARLRSRPPR